MKLSILDQIPVPKNISMTEALARSVELAQLGDALGYERFWLAEHHNTKSLASSAPEITASYIAAVTERIRVGTGGVMMMHYSPLKIAEVFKTLSGLAPGRIDFGAGRAPGGDMAAMVALASGQRPYVDEQYDKFETILRMIADKPTGEDVYDAVVAIPTQVTLPESYMLGSTGQSARVAGEMGVGYSFAQFFQGQLSKQIVDIYKSAFRPSYFVQQPKMIVSYAVSVAETKEEAEYLSMPLQISRLQLMRGNLSQGMSPEEAHNYPLTEMDKAIMAKNRELFLIGTAEEVLDQIQTDMDWYGFDEAMINCNLYSMESRLNSYRLLAEKAFK
ncbi:MAG: LLM class flavin-dependent oxidoreductase [Lysinibacillus sp.]